RERTLKERQCPLVRRRIPSVLLDEFPQLIGQQCADALPAPCSHRPCFLQKPRLYRYRDVRLGHHSRKIREDTLAVNCAPPASRGLTRIIRDEHTLSGGGLERATFNASHVDRREKRRVEMAGDRTNCCFVRTGAGSGRIALTRFPG